jgi:hypothetical protein
MSFSQTAPTTIERLHKRIRRSTWTDRNAEQFRTKLFDVVIDTGADQMVPYESFNYSPNTLRIKIYDALAWLAENHTNKARYQELKSRVTIRAEARGVTVRYKDSFYVIGDSAITQWKDELANFLANAEHGLAKEWSGLRLTLDEQEIVAGVCSEIATWRYENETLRVIKGI